MAAERLSYCLLSKKLNIIRSCSLTSIQINGSQAVVRAPKLFYEKNKMCQRFLPQQTRKGSNALRTVNYEKQYSITFDNRATSLNIQLYSNFIANIPSHSITQSKYFHSYLFSSIPSLIELQLAIITDRVFIFIHFNSNSLQMTLHVYSNKRMQCWDYWKT